MELRALRCFDAVATELHFGRAAERLHVAPSVVTEQVQRLERELGVVLFTRSTRQVRLSDTGRVVLEQARRALHEIDQIRSVSARLAAGDIGSVRIAYRPSAGPLVAALTSTFRRAHPEVTCIPTSVSAHRVCDVLASGNADVGIAAAGSEGMHSLLLAQEPLGCLVVHRDDPLATAPLITIQDLDREPYLLGTRELNPELHEAIVAFFRDHDVEPDYRTFPIGLEQEVVDLVGGGFGMSLLRSSLLDRRADGGALFRPVQGPVPMFHHHLVWQGTGLSAAALQFVEFAVEHRVALGKDASNPCRSSFDSWQTGF